MMPKSVAAVFGDPNPALKRLPNVSELGGVEKKAKAETAGTLGLTALGQAVRVAA